MNFQQVLQGLDSADARERHKTLGIIATVDEVRVLEPLQQLYHNEPETRVKDMAGRVGKRLNTLKQNGFDTIPAICEHFQVYKEVFYHATSEQLKQVEEITADAQRGQRNSKNEENFNDQAVMAASVMLTSRVFGATAALSAVSPSVDLTSSLSSSVEHLARDSKRIPPTRPSNQDLTLWLGRLKDSTGETREQLIIQLNNIGNPAAIPVLAQIHMTDTDEKCKTLSKKFARLLYWQLLYWEMTQDGTIEQLMKTLAAELGITLPEKKVTQELPAAPALEQSLDDILAKADAKRKKRNR